MALTAVITDPGAVRAQQAVAVSCAAPDDELPLMSLALGPVELQAARPRAIRPPMSTL